MEKTTEYLLEKGVFELSLPLFVDKSSSIKIIKGY